MTVEGFFYDKVHWAALVLGVLAILSGFAPRTALAGPLARKTLGVETAPLPARAQAANQYTPHPTGVAQPAPVATCPTPCGPGQSCVGGRCQCALGRGGPSCGFSIEEIYYTDYQSLYGGLQQDPQAFRPLDLQGWSPPPEVYEELLASVDAVTVIELGVWKGLSTSHMANWLKRRGRGVIVSIDTWLGAPEFWGKRPMEGDDPERGMFLRFGWPTVFYSFISNMIHQGLESTVVPVPLPSLQAAALLRRKGLVADLVHIDASHEYGPVRSDIITWWPFVRPGGVLMGDDYIDFWAGVMKAVNEFAVQCDLVVKVTGGVKWYFVKPLEMAPGLPDYCYRGDETQYYGDRTDMVA